MNNAQKLLLRYCQQKEFRRTEITGPAKIRTVDQKGRVRDLTINPFGDIMDANTKKVIAEGNTDHDIKKTYDIPTEWRERKISVLERLNEAKDDIRNEEPQRIRGKNLKRTEQSIEGR